MSLSSLLPLDASTLSPQLTDQLTSQLAAALAADTHNEQVNSAKLRSVGQQHDYDQFRGMVAGAHLHGINLTQQPLDTIAAGRGRTAVREEGGALDHTRLLEYGVGRLSVREQQSNMARQQELLAETQRNATQHKQPATGQPHSTHNWPLRTCSVTAANVSLCVVCAMCSTRLETRLATIGWCGQADSSSTLVSSANTQHNQPTSRE